MQSLVTKEETNNNWIDSCELLFFIETYLYYKTLSSSIISPIPQRTHNISPHISPSIVLLVDILSKITRVRFCHFITKCFNHGGDILKNRGVFNLSHYRHRDYVHITLDPKPSEHLHDLEFQKDRNDCEMFQKAIKEKNSTARIILIIEFFMTF